MTKIGVWSNGKCTRRRRQSAVIFRICGANWGKGQGKRVVCADWGINFLKIALTYIYAYNVIRAYLGNVVIARGLPVHANPLAYTSAADRNTNTRVRLRTGLRRLVVLRVQHSDLRHSVPCSLRPLRGLLLYAVHCGAYVLSKPCVPAGALVIRAQLYVVSACTGLRLFPAHDRPLAHPRPRTGRVRLQNAPNAVRRPGMRYRSSNNEK